MQKVTKILRNDRCVPARLIEETQLLKPLAIAFQRRFGKAKESEDREPEGREPEGCEPEGREPERREPKGHEPEDHELKDDESEDDESEYQYTGGFLKNGITQGITYQLKLLTWVTWKMMSNKNASKWWLGSEVVGTFGFHDLVLKYVCNTMDENGEICNKKYMYRFMQVKYMTHLTKNKRINISSLLSMEKKYCQYSLIYLFKSYTAMLNKFENITRQQIVDMTVFTNRSIDTSLEFLVPVKINEIFDFKEKGTRYRLNVDLLRRMDRFRIIDILRAFTHDERLIWDFLKKIVFAVGQPSESEMEEFIIENMGKVYNMPQIFYNHLFKNIIEWFLILEHGKAPYLTKKHVKKQLKEMENMLG